MTAAKPNAAPQEAVCKLAAFGPGVNCTGVVVGAAAETVTLATGVYEETAVVQEELQTTWSELEAHAVSVGTGPAVHSVGAPVVHVPVVQVPVVHVPVVQVASAGAVQVASAGAVHETAGQSQPVMGSVANTDEDEATRARAEVENFMVTCW